MVALACPSFVWTTFTSAPDAIARDAAVCEVEALADAAGKFRPVILFLAYTGVRFGELAALRLGQLDLLRRHATISEAVAEVGGRIMFSTPKTHQSRTVPIPRFLVDELAALVVGKGSQDLVFTGVKGAVPVCLDERDHPTQIRQNLDEILTKIWLPPYSV
jgi:integrase